MIMSVKQRIKYFLIRVFLITYIPWVIAAIISHINQESMLIFPLQLMGGAGPLIATLLYLIKTKEWKQFIDRMIHFQGINRIAWGITVAPILIILSTQWLVFGRLNVNTEFTALGLSYMLFLLFFGPIPEEVGWRGILFHDLNQQSFKKAQIYTMLVWLIWHLPLFFIVGTYQFDLGVLSLRFLFFCLNVMVQSFIMGYLYVLGKKNIVFVILFHYFVNLFGEMFHKSTNSEIISIALYVILLLSLVIHHQSLFSSNETRINVDGHSDHSL
jgi:membrane protease YdiL (CAAX protease family)